MTTTHSYPSWATVQTSFPILPPSSQRQPHLTPRLLIRPLAPTDLAALYALRAQVEVMKWSSAGRPDANKAETAAILAKFLPPLDTQTFNCAICLRDDEQTLIGFGGVHKLNRGEAYGWPELGYMFCKEYWGFGYATEFVRAVLELWDGLGREAGELRVNTCSVVPVDGQVGTAREVLVAVIHPGNGASKRVLEKCGFEVFDMFEEEDNCEPKKMVELVAFRYFPRTKEGI